MPSPSLAVCTDDVMPCPAKRSEIFPIAWTGIPCAVRRSRSVSRDRWHREVVTVGGAGELPRRANERAGDHTPEPETLDGQLVGNLAQPVELRNRNH